MCFDYDDVAEFQSSKRVKCRKPHKCSGCWKVIAVGQMAENVAGKFDGAFYSYYVCEHCQRMIYSIAAEEIEHGCRWDEAWCGIDDLAQYLAERSEPVKVLDMPTLEDCYRYVAELETERNRRPVATASATFIDGK